MPLALHLEYTTEEKYLAWFCPNQTDEEKPAQKLDTYLSHQKHLNPKENSLVLFLAFNKLHILLGTHIVSLEKKSSFAR
jgi:hypothetical protein